MSGMIMDELRFFFEDAQGRRFLLADAGDFEANESRALLHYIDDEYVWVMRDNLKNIAEYIERDGKSAAPLRAAMAILAVRALWGKHRRRRILWLGKMNRAVISVAKMTPIFHDGNDICLVSPDYTEAEAPIIPICAAYDSLPLPEDVYDVVVVDTGSFTSERMAQIALSLRVGGTLLVLSTAGTGFIDEFPEGDVLFDEDGNKLTRLIMSRELAAFYRERTDKGRIARQKRLTAYILDEIGGLLDAAVSSGSEETLDALIAQAALAEETLLSIYEELVSEDIKYFANRFKESLIEFRLHGGEDARGRIFEDYFALRREMRDKDSF